MTWGFRLIRTPNGVAVYHVYWTEGSELPVACGATPFVAEAADVEDLRFYLQRILDDAMQNPILDGKAFGLFETVQTSTNDEVDDMDSRQGE